MKKRGETPENGRVDGRRMQSEQEPGRSDVDVSEHGESEGVPSRDKERAVEMRATLMDEEQKKSFGRFGDFSPDALGKDHRIHLTADDARVVDGALRSLHRSARSSLTTGLRIAAEYDISVNNFSTNTAIITLPDGKKLFAVYAHRMSAVHRTLDGVMKHAAGLRMGKVSRGKWKRAFESHARIPLVACDDPYTTLMPYIPNVNAYDLIANNHHIKNFGEVTWAGSVNGEEKKKLLSSVVREIADIHRSGIAWGECILPNLIFTKDKEAIMCDPEIRYDADVPLPEAQARDLMDILLSSCAAMRKSEGETNFDVIVTQMLDEYPDDNIIAVLQGLCDAPFTLKKKLSFWNEKLRTGINDKEEYDAVIEAIQAYRRK